MKKRYPGQRLIYLSWGMFLTLFAAMFALKATGPHPWDSNPIPWVMAPTVAWLVAATILYLRGIGLRDEAMAHENAERWADAEGFRLPRTDSGEVDWPAIKRSVDAAINK